MKLKLTFNYNQQQQEQRCDQCSKLFFKFKLNKMNAYSDFMICSRCADLLDAVAVADCSNNNNNKRMVFRI